MAHKRRASLLVALAHPDDEIFHGGVLAHLSDRGARVTLVCATDGEAGKPHPSVGPVDDLGALRVEELRRSCAATRDRGTGVAAVPRFSAQRAAAPRRSACARECRHARRRSGAAGNHCGRQAARRVDLRTTRQLLPSRSRCDSPRHDRGVLRQRRDGSRSTRTSLLRRDASRSVSGVC